MTSNPTATTPQHEMPAIRAVSLDELRLAGGGIAEPEWRYVPVRRYYS